MSLFRRVPAPLLRWHETCTTGVESRYGSKTDRRAT